MSHLHLINGDIYTGKLKVRGAVVVKDNIGIRFPPAGRFICAD